MLGKCLYVVKQKSSGSGLATLPDIFDCWIYRVWTTSPFWVAIFFSALKRFWGYWRFVYKHINPIDFIHMWRNSYQWSPNTTFVEVFHMSSSAMLSFLSFHPYSKVGEISFARAFLRCFPWNGGNLRVKCIQKRALMRSGKMMGFLAGPLMVLRLFGAA